MIEGIVRGPVDLVAVKHAGASAQLPVELPGDRFVDVRLAAAVVAHDDDVAEAVEGRLVSDTFEHGSEQVVRYPEGPGNRFCIIRRIRQHGQDDRVAEFPRDRYGRLMRDEGVATVRVLRAPLLGAAGENERSRLPRRDRAL